MYGANHKFIVVSNFRDMHVGTISKHIWIYLAKEYSQKSIAIQRLQEFLHFNGRGCAPWPASLSAPNAAQWRDPRSLLSLTANERKYCEITLDI